MVYILSFDVTQLRYFPNTYSLSDMKKVYDNVLTDLFCI